MRIFQIEHFKGRVVSGLIISLDNGILQRSLFDGLIVHKDSLATQTDPLIGRGGNADLDIGIGLQLLVNFLEVAGVEPQLAILLEAEHKGAALGLTVKANGGEILNGVFLQKLGDFFHDNYLQSVFCLGKVAFSFRWYYNNFVEPIRKVSTILCRSYQKETIGGYTMEDIKTIEATPAKDLPACPVETTLMLIGDKWKVLILRDLMPGTKRFGELKKSIGHISQKVLTAQLRDMEASGLVNRKIYAEVPPRVEYTLTELGYTLKPVLDAPWNWGEKYKAKQ